MRRQAGALVPLEAAILRAGVDAIRGGHPEFHGFSMAKSIQQDQDARRLTAHGTLYKALARMEQAGLLESRWEDPAVAEAEQRPRRRLYRVTALGQEVLVAGLAHGHEPAGNLRPGVAPA